MLQELNKYLKELRKGADRLERTSINGKIDESCKAKYLVRVILFVISVVIFGLLKNGFDETFISYVSSALSILVGLFITALIFSFDKFYEPNSEDTSDSVANLWEVQSYNYAKQFAYITGHTIVLSVFTLALLAVSALFENETKLNVFDLRFCIDCIKTVDIDSLLLFPLAVFVIVQRILVLYWLLRIMYNTLFIVSSMVQYMTVKIDKKK